MLKHRCIYKNSGYLFSRTACLLLASVVLFLGFSVASASAQSAGSSTLQGTVADSSGAVVPGAQVTVTNVATGVAHTLTTNADGFYTEPGLQGGDYRISVVR